MTPYHIQLEDFALSDQGIHLLRSRFNYKTIPYNDVKKAVVERATEINNGPVILFFGICLAAFALFQTKSIFEAFNDPEVYHIYVETIVLPVIPALLAVYCFYAGLKKGLVLRLEERGKVHKLRLKTAVKDRQLTDLETYLRTQLGSKFTVSSKG